MNIGWLIGMTLIAAFLQGALFSYANLKALYYNRHFDRKHAFEGDKAALVEVIKNIKPLPVPWLRAESRISKNLQFAGEDAEREINAEQYHKSIFFLPPFSQIQRKHDLVCAKRGAYLLGNVSVTTGDLLCAAKKSKQFAGDCSLIVYPRLLSDSELDATSSRFLGELMVKRWIMPDPFLTSGVRGYQSGDPVRDIHWRASARLGDLQVKVRDYTADPRMMVVLNVQTSENQWGELMEAEQEAIEQGIRIAATLCLRALSMGVEAGFATNGCLMGEAGQGLPVIVPSKRHAAQQEILLDTMARVLIHRELTFPTCLDALSHLRGEDILILSTYESEAIDLRAKQLRMRGNAVTFLKLEGGRRDA